MSKKIHTGEQVSNPTIGENLEAKTTKYKVSPNRECLVCGQQWATDDALMLPDGAVTLMESGLCHVHETTTHVHLVSVDQDKSPKHLSGQVIPLQVVRTGAVATLTNTMFRKLFVQQVPAQHVVFVNDDVVRKLKALQEDLDTVAKGVSDGKNNT